MSDRRDFLKFSAGTLLATALANIGLPDRVVLASPMEVERLTKPLLGPPTFWDLRLMRGTQTILGFRGHPRSTLRWMAADSTDEIILEDGGRMRDFIVMADVR